MPEYRELTELPNRLFAVGDIHACKAELGHLLDYLVGQEQITKSDVVVFIGDYIDRGPDSKGVIELLIQFRQSFPDSVFLRGNHEDMLLSFLGFKGREGTAYLLNGGEEFLSSYGIKPKPDEALTGTHVQEQLPPDHLAFFQSLTAYLITSEWMFAHAGVNPLRDVRHQVPADLFWIRDEFIENIHYFKRVVVFGHTPYEDILFHLPYKIGIDTGLVYGNRLSCIEVRSRVTYQIRRGETKIEKGKFPAS